MKFWQSIAFTPMDHLFDIARVADETGFEGLGLAHHLITPETIRSPYPYTEDNTVWWDPAAPFADPWVTSAALGAVTERIRFCTSIFILPMHDPFTIAKAVSTAAAMTGDRIVLGVACGWMKEEFDLTGQDFSNRGRRMDEMLIVMEQLFSGKMAGFDGEFFSYEPIQMSPTPGERVPVYIGGHSPAALRRAARHDGWFGAGPYTPEEAFPVLDELRRARADAATLDRDYDTVIGFTTPPDLDLYRRLEEDYGVTSVVIVPGYYLGNANPTVGERLDFMKQFGDDVIAKM